MKPWAEKFYKSKQWQRCRASYVVSVHGLCERCLNVGKIVNGSILHHKIRLTPQNIHNTDVTLNYENLEFLCPGCHGKAHGIKSACADGLRFDEFGNIVPA